MARVKHYRKLLPVHQLATDPTIVGLIKHIDGEWWPGDRPTTECLSALKPPKLTDEFSGLDQLGLFARCLTHRLSTRWLPHQSAPRLLNEMRAFELLALSLVCGPNRRRERGTAYKRWEQSEFNLESVRFKQEMIELAIEQRDPADTNPREHPRVFAEILMIAPGLSDTQQLGYWHEPAEFVADMQREGSPLWPLAQQIARDQLSMEFGHWSHDPRARRLGIVDKHMVVKRPELLPSWLETLGGVAHVGVFTPKGLAVSGRLVKSVLDEQFGRRTRSKHKVIVDSDGVIESGETSHVQFRHDRNSPAVETAVARTEAREAIDDAGLAEILAEIVRAIDEHAEHEPESALALASELVKVCGLVRAAPDAPAKAALLYVWARSYGGAGLSRERVCAHFGVAVNTERHREPRARSILQAAGIGADAD